MHSLRCGGNFACSLISSLSIRNLKNTPENSRQFSSITNNDVWRHVMSRLIMGVAALSLIAAIILGSVFLLNPFGKSVDAKRVGNSESLPKSLLPVVAESLGSDDESYHISSGNETYTANTPNQGLKTEFREDSVTFTSGKQSVALKLSSIGRGDQLVPVAQVSDVNSQDNKLEYTRGNVTEWYVNSPFGMEQGFTLSQRPQGLGEEAQIILDLHINGDLAAKDGSDGKSIKFTNLNDQEVISYGKLYVYDSQGNELESSMKLSNERIVIAFNDQGALYPVVVDPFVEVQRLLASNGNSDDAFGFSSAINMNFAIVGAPDKGRGWAYIFERIAGTWTEVLAIRGRNFGASSGAAFGASVDIVRTRAVGVTGQAIIGAPFDDVGGGFSHGSAFIFERNGAGTWSFAENIRASSIQTLAFFGSSVSIRDGVAFAGAPNEDIGFFCFDVGATYVYEKNGSWPVTETQRLTASDGGCFDFFGAAVSVSADSAFVGAPGWDDILFSFDEGAAYTFDRTGVGPWAEQQVLNPSQVDPFDFFGSSVDIYVGKAGEKAIVGAPIAGYGGCGLVCISAGEAYIFERAGTWPSDGVRIRSDQPQSFAVFGSCVGITNSYAISGAPGDAFGSGSGYIYEKDGALWPFSQQIIASDSSAFDFFGTSCGMSGEYIVVGAPGNDIEDTGDEDDQGAAYIFEPATGMLTIEKVTVPEGFVGNFDFAGSDNLNGTPCEAFSLSDSDSEDCGELTADTYTINETETLGATVSVECDSGVWNQVDDGVVVELEAGDDITCTFTNTLPLELSNIFPAVESNPNFMTAFPATSNGPVGFIWGFQLGTFPISIPCGDIELGINPFIFLGVFNAGANQIVNMTFFINLGGYANPAYAQAVDLTTCVVSDVVANIILNTNLN